MSCKFTLLPTRSGVSWLAASNCHLYFGRLRAKREPRLFKSLNNRNFWLGKKRVLLSCSSHCRDPGTWPRARQRFRDEAFENKGPDDDEKPKDEADGETFDGEFRKASPGSSPQRTARKGSGGSAAVIGEALPARVPSHSHYRTTPGPKVSGPSIEECGALHKLCGRTPGTTESSNRLNFSAQEPESLWYVFTCTT